MNKDKKDKVMRYGLRRGNKGLVSVVLAVVAMAIVQNNDVNAQTLDSPSQPNSMEATNTLDSSQVEQDGNTPSEVMSASEGESSSSVNQRDPASPEETEGVKTQPDDKAGNDNLTPKKEAAKQFVATLAGLEITDKENYYALIDQATTESEIEGFVIDAQAVALAPVSGGNAANGDRAVDTENASAENSGSSLPTDFIDERQSPARRDTLPNGSEDLNGIMASKFEVYQDPNKDYNENKNAWIAYMDRLYTDQATADTKESYDLALPTGWDLRFSSFSSKDQYNEYLSNWYDNYFDGQHNFITGSATAPDKGEATTVPEISDLATLYGRVGQQRNDALIQIKLNNVDFKTMSRSDWNALGLQLNFMRLRSTYYPNADFSIVDEKGTPYTGYLTDGEFRRQKELEGIDTAYYGDPLSQVNNDIRYSVRFYNPIWEIDLSPYLGTDKKFSVLDLLNYYAESTTNNPYNLNNKSVGSFETDFNSFVEENWMNKTFSTIMDDIILALKNQQPETYAQIGEKFGVEGEALDNKIKELLEQADSIRQFIANNGDWALRNRYVPGGTSARIPLKMNFSKAGSYTVSMDLNEADRYYKGGLKAPYRDFTVTSSFGGLFTTVTENPVSSEQQTAFRTQAAKQYTHKPTAGSYNSNYVSPTEKGNLHTDYLKVSISQPKLVFNDSDRLGNETNSTGIVYDGENFYKLQNKATATVNSASQDMVANALDPYTEDLFDIAVLDDHKLGDHSQAVIDKSRIRVSLAAYKGDEFNADEPTYIGGVGSQKVMTLEALKALLPTLDQGRYKVKYFYSAPDSITKSAEDVSLGNESSLSQTYAANHDGLSGIVWSENYLYRDLTIIKKGTFEEKHIYITKVDDQEVSRDEVNNPQVTGYNEETFTTAKRDRPDYTLESVDNIGGTSVTLDNPQGTFHFENGINKQVIYTYLRNLYTGTFQEHHRYETYRDGVLVSEQTLTEDGPLQKGLPSATYITGKVVKEGYTFNHIENIENDPVFNQDGSQASGNFVSKVAKAITYVYRKDLAAIDGRFIETHIYNTYNNGVLVSSEKVIGKDITDVDGASFTTYQKDRDGYDLIEIHGNFAGNSEGHIVGGTTQEMTYIYQRDISPTPNRPLQPSEPGQPSQPDKPNEPGQPGEPDEPNQPDKPNEPGQPGEPDKPNQPGEPDEPNQPDKSNEPGGATPSNNPGNKTPGSKNSESLPDTGEVQDYLLFGGSVVAILTGLGLLVVTKPHEEN